MHKPFKDYYEVLGIPRTASDAEISSRYRELRKELSSTGGEETKNRVRLSEIGEAYTSLGSGGAKAENRTQYNKDYDLHQEKVRLAKEREYKVAISDNDLGLLYALREAYRSPGPGDWDVKKSEQDTRDWMPDTIYTVRRKEDGSVLVFRTIKDWREHTIADTEIQIPQQQTVFKPDERLHEWYLGAGAREIEGGGVINTTYNAPNYFGKYLSTMKSLARKLASPLVEGKYNVGTELEKIGTYTVGKDSIVSRISRLDYHIRMEDEPENVFNRRHEVGLRIPMSEFLPKLTTVGGRVQLRGSGKEGQQAPTPEGLHVGGENKG